MGVTIVSFTPQKAQPGAGSNLGHPEPNWAGSLAWLQILQNTRTKMSMTKSRLKAYMRQIAALYGCKVHFTRSFAGGFAHLDGNIAVGLKSVPADQFITVFCHELAHHCNQIDGRFKLYHHPDQLWFNPKKIKDSFNYAYRAEQFTDRVGRELCSVWFPQIEYTTAYTGSKRSRMLLYRYYFGS
jgi:hypothetical protein